MDKINNADATNNSNDKGPPTLPPSGGGTDLDDLEARIRALDGN